MTYFGRRRIYGAFIHSFGAERAYKSDDYVRCPGRPSSAIFLRQRRVCWATNNTKTWCQTHSLINACPSLSCNSPPNKIRNFVTSAGQFSVERLKVYFVYYRLTHFIQTQCTWPFCRSSVSIFVHTSTVIKWLNSRQNFATYHSVVVFLHLTSWRNYHGTLNFVSLRTYSTECRSTLAPITPVDHWQLFVLLKPRGCTLQWLAETMSGLSWFPLPFLAMNSTWELVHCYLKSIDGRHLTCPERASRWSLITVLMSAVHWQWRLMWSHTTGFHVYVAGTASGMTEDVVRQYWELSTCRLHDTVMYTEHTMRRPSV